MSQFENNKVVRQGGGNFVTYGQMRDMHQEEDSDPIRACEKCGKSETTFRGIPVNVPLTDGICGDCLNE